MQDLDDLWVGRFAWDFICVDAKCCNWTLACAVVSAAYWSKIKKSGWDSLGRTTQSEGAQRRSVAPICEDADEEQCHVKW